MIAITPSLSPNVQREDVFRAFRTILTPWNAIGGNSIKQLEQWFRSFFKVTHAISFNSGRSGFFAILKSLNVSMGDEVILQAFTCVVVPDVIVAVGAKPVYVDILDNLTMDPKGLEAKITPKTKAILVQHTFGIPSSMKDIVSIAKKHKLPIIEDCAHTVGGEVNDKKLGVIGTVGFFSFGRDKAFSSVFGGMVITNNNMIGKKIRAFQKQLPYPSYAWTLQQLFHPIAFSFILPLYTSGVGKALLVVLQKLKMLSFPVSAIEKAGGFNPRFVQKMPNGLAALAVGQLKRAAIFNNHRKSLAALYIKEIPESLLPFKSSDVPLLRFPVIADNPEEIVKKMRQQNIYLGRWYSEVIDPKGSNLEKVNYIKGMCKNAEEKAQHIINLPTHPRITKVDAKKSSKSL